MAKATKTRAKTGKGEATQLVAFRLEESLLARLDTYAKGMEEKIPGLTFNRSDAVRALLTRALDGEGAKR
jgi:hypothetical protein